MNTPCGVSASVRVRRAVLVDHRRVLVELRLGALPGWRGLNLARSLLYLSAYALQRRRDALRQGVLPLRRLLPDLRLRRALSEGEVHHNLATSFAVVANRQPPRVIASCLGAPLYPALACVHCEVALGLEGSFTLARVLQ